MLAEGEADRLAILRERRGIDDEVDLGLRFVTAPEAHLVVDEIDAGAAFDHIVGADDFVEMHADFGGGVRHRETNEGGVFFEAAPVAPLAQGSTPASPDA